MSNMKDDVKQTVGNLVAEGTITPSDEKPTHAYNPVMKQIEPVPGDEKKKEE